MRSDPSERIRRYGKLLGAIMAGDDLFAAESSLQLSLDRFKDQIRALTMRRMPLRLGELIETINPIIR
ncbi:hypothetical protein QA640_38975 [Bradyrhizobium sp. CB82]|uniref:hypothetical protein n=1 Tax=Bradyrhizobium sp. CB82 TaxID=3039159 RepID=UPI0024B1FFD5|nr:hypothetical protein [Bradyrhizobium sp. CB82]WFU40136.1 hypothetical protein QA640_38975 [Bradyrhizobium sp. CB82]